MKPHASALGMLLVSLVWCASPRRTLNRALTAYTPTPSDSPVTAQDSVLRLVLEQAVRNGIPDFSPRPTVLLLAVPGVVSSRILPRVDSVRFFLLEKSELEQLVDQTDDLVYLSVGLISIEGHKARAGVGSHFALRRRPDNQPVVLLAGGGCSWTLSRHTDGWVVDSVDACLIS